MNVRPLESLTKEELIELIRHEREQTEAIGAGGVDGTVLFKCRRPGQVVKAFREYLRVHPVGEHINGHDADDMALELARIALDFQSAAPTAHIGWDMAAGKDETVYHVSVGAEPKTALAIQAAILRYGDARASVTEARCLNSPLATIHEAVDEAAQAFADVCGLIGAGVSAKPVAWLRNLSEPQPYAITDLRYRAVSETEADYTPVYAAPIAAPVSAEPVAQYYYQVTGCSAVESSDDGCICWHDKGTGPFPDAQVGDIYNGVTLTWRRPKPTAPVAAQANKMPDAARIALDSLDADAVYLLSRVKQETMSMEEGAALIRQRIEAARTSIVAAQPDHFEQGLDMVPVQAQQQPVSGADGTPSAEYSQLELRITGCINRHLATALVQGRVLDAAREIAGFLPATQPQPSGNAGEFPPIPDALADALADALSNLEHDNYERSYSGSKNRESDAALIRAALAQQDADPLQGAAEWLLKAVHDCEARDLQHRLLIGHNRATRLIDAARKEAGR